MTAGCARLTTEGGFAYFPGRSRVRVVDFAAADPDTVAAIVRAAEAAGFFERSDAVASRPDARCHCLDLTIDGRSHSVRMTEPVADPALAALVAAVRAAGQPEAGG